MKIYYDSLPGQFCISYFKIYTDIADIFNMYFFRKIILALLVLPVSQSLKAQDEKPYVEPTGLNNWYFEIGGSGLFYSFNYEKVLFKSEYTALYGRVGFGYNLLDYTFLNKVTLDHNTVMVPFTSSFTFGKGKEKFEVGGGFTMLAKNISDREIVPTFVLGFRVIETNKTCFRITYTPFIRGDKYVDWFGVSIGRNFSLKNK